MIKDEFKEVDMHMYATPFTKEQPFLSLYSSGTFCIDYQSLSKLLEILKAFPRQGYERGKEEVFAVAYLDSTEEGLKRGLLIGFGYGNAEQDWRFATWRPFFYMSIQEAEDMDMASLKEKVTMRSMTSIIRERMLVPDWED